MLDRPLTFVLINFISFLVILSIGGFAFAFPTAVAMSLFILKYNYKKLGFIGGLNLSIIYMLAFDTELFYFTVANIRVWYVYLVIIYGSLIVRFLNVEEVTIKKSNVVEYFCLGILGIWSLYFLIMEPDVLSKVNNIKYWVFYVGLILALNNFFKYNIMHFNEIRDFIISITIFICFWGIFQFFTNLLFIPNFQQDFFNIRPSGFFSETTWYSEFTFFGLLLIFLKVVTDKSSQGYIYFIPFFFLGFLLSVTRNTFLGFFIFLFISALLVILVEKKIHKALLFSTFFKFLLSLVAFSFLYALTRADEVVGFFSAKFTGQDESAQGRIEAYKITMEGIMSGGIIGNGYAWDSSQTTESGSALGAKSFNLFFMVAHIFGLIGFFFFLVLLASYFVKMFYNYHMLRSVYIRYAIIIFIVFIQMAMFAPIHQYPFGMLIVSISVFLLNKGLHEKDRVFDAPV